MLGGKSAVCPRLPLYSFGGLKTSHPVVVEYDSGRYTYVIGASCVHSRLGRSRWPCARTWSNGGRFEENGGCSETTARRRSIGLRGLSDANVAGGKPQLAFRRTPQSRWHIPRSPSGALTSFKLPQPDQVVVPRMLSESESWVVPLAVGGMIAQVRENGLGGCLIGTIAVSKTKKRLLHGYNGTTPTAGEDVVLILSGVRDVTTYFREGGVSGARPRRRSSSLSHRERQRRYDIGRDDIIPPVGDSKHTVRSVVLSPTDHGRSIECITHRTGGTAL